MKMWEDKNLFMKFLGRKTIPKIKIIINKKKNTPHMYLLKEDQTYGYNINGLALFIIMVTNQWHFSKKQKIESIYIINNVKLILLFSQER